MSNVIKGAQIEGLQVYRLDRYDDERGFFQEVFNVPRLHASLERDFVQDNVVRSTHGVLRGLHFQDPNPQGKLITVLEGEVFDVVVDVRRESPTFGKWSGVNLSESNGLQLYIPEGCAHGYLVLSDDALVYYKCTAAYDHSGSRYLRWDDPDVGIEWPLDSYPVLSERDRNAPLLSELELG